MEGHKSNSALLESTKMTSRTSLCDHCSGIFSQVDTLRILASKPGLQYCRKKCSMIQTALDGCALCRELICMPYDYKWEEAGVKKPIFVRGFDDRRSWPINLWASTAQKQGSRLTSTVLARMLARCRDPNFLFQWKGSLNSSPFIKVVQHQTPGCQRSLVLEAAVASDDPATAFISNQLVNCDVTCEKTYKLIRQWLARCDIDHIKCHKVLTTSTSSAISPAMVLDVSPFTDSECEMIRLHRVSGRKIPYAALSYRWGTFQPKATRASNVIAYLEGIELSSLPQTLQDAVIVTRKLGLQYLWVDSMCIIQDSDEDKIHEIGRMERIYSNAYVTISASSSADCTAGFLSHRELKKKYIKIPFQTELKESTNLAIRSIREPGDGYYGVIRSEPIESRAWTFQESFMSRRVIIFSSHQLFWACGKVWGADGGNMSRYEYYRRPGVDLSVRPELVNSHHFMETPTASDWMQIVQLYSLRQLGDPLDKLPALSSIASYFARKLDDKYMAGLWYNCLPRMLCWRGNNGLTRADAWRSPSWSFFSVDGQLHFEHYSTELQDLECTILSCQTIPLSAQAPFGRISSAALTVQGRIIQVRPRESLPVDGSLMVRHTTSRLEIGTLFFDTLKSGDKVLLSPIVSTNHGDHFCAQPVWFLTLTAKLYRITSGGGGSVGAAIPDRSEWRPWGLALAKLPDGRYHRIGYIEGNNHARRVFRKQQGETITIV